MKLLSGSDRGDPERRGRGRSEGGERRYPAVLREQVLDTARARAVVERPVRAAVLLDRLEQVVVAFRVEGLVGLLGVEAGAGQVAVDEARRELLPEDRLHRREADVDLAAPAVSAQVDR